MHFMLMKGRIQHDFFSPERISLFFEIFYEINVFQGNTVPAQLRGQ